MDEGFCEGSSEKEEEKAKGHPDDVKYFDTVLFRDVIFRYNNKRQAYDPYPKPDKEAIKKMKEAAAEASAARRRKSKGFQRYWRCN